MTPRSRRAFLAGTGLAGVAALAGCVGFTGPTATDQSTLTEPLDGVERLHVDNQNGDVRVEADPELEGEVRMEVTKRVAGDAGLFGDVAVETSTGSGRLTISTHYDTQRARRVAVEYDVAVPPSLIVERIRTANGNATAVGVVGDTTVETANGDALARNVDGAVTVRSSNGDAVAEACTAVDGGTTANGDVEVEVLSLPDDAEFRSGNGDVEVGVAAGIDATFTLTTGNGRVTVEDVDAEFDRDERQRVEGTLGAGGPSIRASSANGDVRLYGL